MLRVLGKILTVVSLLLCAATLLLWKAEPNWIGLGWAGQSELEIHAADGYVELTCARHMTINKLYHGQLGNRFAFYRHDSAWGNPLMGPWQGGSAYIGSAVWYGCGRAAPDAAGVRPWALWLAADSHILGLLFLFLPGARFFVRFFRHQPPLKRVGAA